MTRTLSAPVPFAPVLCVLALVLGATLPRPALAQLGNPATISQPGGNLGPGPRQQGGKREPAPPALPGSRAEPTAVAPASKVPTDMPPTEALFDAINRGDLPTAKDAINRGADINGANILGLTPLELAVDLGRNEISFLLLSLRGGAGYSTASGPAQAPRGPSAAESRAERLAAQRAERTERASRVRQSAAEPLPAAPQTARLFSGNGGAPAPQAGFLGFDAGR